MSPEALISTWLAELGVTLDRITPEQRRGLDEDGYLVLPNHMPDQLLGQFRERTNAFVTKRPVAGLRSRRSVRSLALDDRLSQGEFYDPLLADSSILTAAHQVLGPEFRVKSVTCETILPGEGRQGFHTDWTKPARPGNCQVMSATWCLDDFAHDSGATRVLPGSHRWRRLPRDIGDRVAEKHSGAICLTAQAGSVIVLNGYLWRARGPNNSHSARSSLTVSYCQCAIGPSFGLRDEDRFRAQIQERV